MFLFTLDSCCLPCSVLIGEPFGHVQCVHMKLRTEQLQPQRQLNRQNTENSLTKMVIFTHFNQLSS